MRKLDKPIENNLEEVREEYSIYYLLYQVIDNIYKLLDRLR